MTSLDPTNPSVFVSYSHKDLNWIHDIKRHFKPIEKYVKFWDDSMLIPGERWNDSIQESLTNSKIVLLLISADYLSSKYVLDHELPNIIEAAKLGDKYLMIIILKPCLIDEFPELLEYQFINSPSKPVIGMTETEREDLWVKTLKTVKIFASNIP